MARRKDPVNLYYSFTLNVEFVCVENVGRNKKKKKNVVEPSLKYHPVVLDVLTWAHYLGRGPCMVGSLTGAVSS